SIRLDYDPDGVQLIVTDSAGDGAERAVPQPAALAGAGAGYGVSGMRGRAELIGGGRAARAAPGGLPGRRWVAPGGRGGGAPAAAPCGCCAPTPSGWPARASPGCGE